ncbi:Carrier protein, mitochondrial [Entomophthora muscae]|uniref:Carrier protein, mitochondrial n=1 Tax=Entomophthora muscae TaxID=34485 RepID=A0ACC2TFX1_9FUNG|nr:Carrier protein, mitochondrial [Entomophthora muscae]
MGSINLSMDSLDFLEVENRPTEFSKSLSIPQALQGEALKPSHIGFDETKHWQKMVSACAGSFMTSLVVTPFDVIKTRLQFQSIADNIPRQRLQVPQLAEIDYFFCRSAAYRSLLYSEWPLPYTQLASSFSISDPVPNTLKFTGTIDALSKIARHEGISRLWRGLSPTLLQSFPSTVIYYVGYDALRDSLAIKLADSPQAAVYSPLLAGALARSLSATVISPIELFRTRLQSAGKGQTFQDIAQGVSQMVRSQGIGSLWKGLTPTLWRDVPFSAVYWMGYEAIKAELIEASEDRLSHFTVAFLSGASSGVFAATITTPFDVIKTRHQVNDQSSHAAFKPEGTFQVMSRIVRNEGWKELFRGLTARVAKVAPACAIMVSSYEFGKKFFANQNLLERNSRTGSADPPQ